MGAFSVASVFGVPTGLYLAEHGGWRMPFLGVAAMGLVRRPENAFGAYAKHLVKINVHELGTGTGALGV